MLTLLLGLFTVGCSLDASILSEALNATPVAGVPGNGGGGGGTGVSPHGAFTVGYGAGGTPFHTGAINYDALVKLQSGKILAITDTTSEVFDPSTNMWTATANSFSVKRGGGATLTLMPDGKVFLIGAYDRGNNENRSVEIYNPATNTWASGPSLNVGRESSATILLSNGKLLVAGGDTAGEDSGGFHYGLTNTVELYDSFTGVWTQVAHTLVTFSDARAVQLSSGPVVIGGGFTGNIQIYNPTTDTWSTGPAIRGDSSAQFGNIVKLPDDRVFILNASPNGPGQIYDSGTGLVSDASTSIGGVFENTYGPAVGLLSNGKIIVAGGGSGSSQQAQTYDPVTDTWSSLPNLNNAHDALTLGIILNDGRFLVVGGNDMNSTSEAFAQGGSAWDKGAVFLPPMMATSYLLKSGKIIVFGMYGQSSKIFDFDTGVDSASAAPGFFASFVRATSGDIYALNITATGGAIYDEQSDSWTPQPSWPKLSGILATTVGLSDGKIFVAGGEDLSTNAPTTSGYILDPATGVADPIAPMPVALFAASSIALSDDRVVVLGGCTSPSGCVASRGVYIYDRATNQWSSGPNLLSPRGSGGAVMLADQTILIVGGLDDSSGSPVLLASSETVSYTHLTLPTKA